MGQKLWGSCLLPSSDTHQSADGKQPRSPSIWPLILAVGSHGSYPLHPQTELPLCPLLPSPPCSVGNSSCAIPKLREERVNYGTYWSYRAPVQSILAETPVGRDGNERLPVSHASSGTTKLLTPVSCCYFFYLGSHQARSLGLKALSHPH